ncbi:hypothetical protein [Lysinibacillus sp. Y5S-8]|uniref:hypothetical protein n=1 Tax=Lysinibacillus sp. Y5S-8 TaxID=3122488 RepID=UPI0030D33319
MTYFSINIYHSLNATCYYVSIHKEGIVPMSANVVEGKLPTRGSSTKSNIISNISSGEKIC